MTSIVTVPSETAILQPGGERPDAMVALDGLFDRVWRRRFTTFLAIQGEVVSLAPDDPATEDFLDHATGVLLRDADARRTLVTDPAFQSWQWLMLLELNRRLVGTEQDSEPLRRRLGDFAPMLARIDGRAESPDTLTFHRLDMDPMIAAALPPSYVVPATADAVAAAQRYWHPTGFIRDIVGVALDRIADTWPEARSRFDRLVRRVIYLPDGDFRSCSALRYAGVIMFSVRDGSLLDLEESLVHECAHQLLYHVVEDTPVTTADPTVMFRLPWSGQERDLYGYFHAFYVYVELSHYFERVMNRRPRDREMAGQRLKAILTGLRVALPDFEQSDGFTDVGRVLFAALSTDIGGLLDRHRALVGR